LRAIDDPAHIGIASRLLGHRSASTTERYYNQARSLEASRLMQTSLLSLRQWDATWARIAFISTIGTRPIGSQCRSGASAPAVKRIVSRSGL
jgi:hypothetical protein